MEPLPLLRGVREVAALAKPAKPEAVTQRLFDAERERNPEYAALPPARRITERLKLSWVEVLAIAHAPRSEQGKLLAVKDREPSSVDWLNEKHVVAVLQIVAKRLRKKTLTMTEYSVERDKLLAEDRARPADGRLPLPTTSQITRVTGTWGEALYRAKLGPKPKSPPIPEALDYRKWDYDSCIDALARYIAQLPKGVHSPFRGAGYRAWAEGQEHTPALSVIYRRCKGKTTTAIRAARSRVEAQNRLE